MNAYLEGRLEGFEEGKQMGLDEGALNKAHTVARNLLQLNALSIEYIAQVTGLSVEEVLRLKE